MDIEYVQRCKSMASDDMREVMHGAIGCHTLCGKELNEMWFIHSKAGRSVEDVTCKKCIKELKSNQYNTCVLSCEPKRGIATTHRL
jgi:hypothetical protein